VKGILSWYIEKRSFCGDFGWPKLYIPRMLKSKINLR
jgi:hypothetical protein